MLYYFTASDDAAQKHFEDTIKNTYPIKKHIDQLDADTVEKLRENRCAEEVHMWGAVPGKSNKDRWGKLVAGDKILAYSRGTFLYYGTIFAKTRNVQVAKEVWGTDGDSQTWEYIYFIKNLREVNISSKDFAAFFGYKLNFKPQGFSNIQKDKLDIRMRKYGTIDELIQDLDQNFIMSDEENEEDSYQANIDSSFDKIDTTVSEKPESKKKPRTVDDKQVWPRDAKKAKIALKRAEFKCEIDPEHTTFISESSNKPYMEAHHLIPMKMQHEYTNSLDVVGNIVCICPQCHRAIHYAKPNEKKKFLDTLYCSREDVLKKYGIEISFEDLLGAYAISMNKSRK